jgi:hypothetical protein
MNPTYQRYLNDERFRDAVLGQAHRERSAAMARFFSSPIRFLFQNREPNRATRTHFARQG